MYTSFKGDHEEQPLSVAETNDTEMNVADALIAGNENILDEPKTSAANSETTITHNAVSDNMATKTDETPNHIKTMPVVLPSLAEQDKHTTPGSCIMLHS